MNKEYTCNIDKYTIGVDENGKDEIGLIQVGFVGMYYHNNLYLKN